MRTESTVQGTVIEFRWANPHSYIYLDVNGTRWTLEAEALNLLRRYGWTKETLRPGDALSCLGARAKDANVHGMKCFTITMADGRKLAATPLTLPPTLPAPKTR
jgi:hypothetical protein